MELDYNKIVHNYIIRVIIFSIFLYKNKIMDAESYKRSVCNYVYDKTKLDIYIDVDELDKETNRANIINSVLYDKKSVVNVRVKVKTPYKGVSLTININDEKKYKEYLYS